MRGDKAAHCWAAAVADDSWRMQLVRTVQNDFETLLDLIEDTIDSYRSGYRSLGPGDVRAGLAAVTKIVLACVLYDRLPTAGEIDAAARLAAHRGRQGIGANELGLVMDVALQAALSHIVGLAATEAAVPPHGLVKLTDRVLVTVHALKDVMTLAAATTAGVDQRSTQAAEVWVESVLARRWADEGDLAAAAEAIGFPVDAEVGIVVLVAGAADAGRLRGIGGRLWREAEGHLAPGRPASTPVPHLPLLVANGAAWDGVPAGVVAEAMRHGLRVVSTGGCPLAEAADLYEWCLPNLRWAWAAPAPGPVVGAAELAILALYAAAGGARRRATWRAVLGRLDGHADEARAWRVLEALVEHGTVAAAASALQSSRGTVGAVVDLVARLTGFDWRNSRHRHTIEAAVLCRRLDPEDCEDAAEQYRHPIGVLPSTGLRLVTPAAAPAP